MKITRKYYVLILVLLIQSTSLFAQYTSIRGWFKVDFIRGCQGLTVTVDTTGAAPIPCFYGASCPVEWGDGTQGQNVTTHTYIDGGVFNLKVFFQNDNGPDSIQIDINESLPPEFNLYACTGQQVAVNIPDTGYDNYVINNGEGIIDTVPQGAINQIYTYATTSEKTITIRGLDNDAADNCSGISQKITPLNALPAGAINSLTVISTDAVVLDYSLANNILYQLQIAANGNPIYAPLKTLTSATASDTIRGLDFDNNYYCFRIASKNACDNSTDNLSETVCSINLSLDPQDNFNRLSWVTEDPTVSFSIFRDDMPATPLQTLGPGNRSLDDSTILCDTEYCYTIVGNYTNGITSTSLMACGTTFSTVPPNPIQNISTVVSGESITLSWEPPFSNNDLEYAIYAIRNGRRILLGKTDSTTTYEIPMLDTTQEHCFEILVTDACANESTQSIEGCNIVLNGSADKEDNIELDWFPYQGWVNGVNNYTIQKVYGTGGISVTTTADTAFSEIDNSPNQVIFYTIIANPTDNINESISNTVQIIKPNNIYFPNAFTPDNNGVNDTFMLNGRFITSFELLIFNRWGRLIYATTSMNEGWDGTLEGQALPEGTYAFKATMTDQAGREIEKDGTIVLLRRR